MGRRPELRCSEFLRLSIPGTVRVQFSLYVPTLRQYHPVPGFSARIVVDTPERALELWNAVDQVLREKVVSWPDLGDEIPPGFGVVSMPDALTRDEEDDG